ncbi:hypothetical protein JMT66_23405 (plasmid) [Kosakonia cowanii]|uniref:hypothetical protein n=1 Tax=Kosakonia cowanii TaxID=208223 RepID=UPI001E654E73|nr:hypothetical protein [Kosakonia cowanii]UGS48627.1 hypothetical protein JMT66_23405 [Kosakonia cowanii]
MNLPESVGPVPVVRTPDGYWCHPALTAFYRDRDCVPQAEYDHWLADNGLEDTLVCLDPDEDTPAAQAYARNADISYWTPPVPAGKGWFTGAIFDDEDYGPACIWLRRREVPCDAG